MNIYKAINKQTVCLGEYKIVPIRFEDRYSILEWRNEQMYHLRQKEKISKKEQDNYFNTVVKNLFLEENPSQVLFSFLKKENCIGYGGLVHINWEKKEAEISFIMQTSLEKEQFDFNWSMFLVLIEKIAFIELNLRKINTYAFDLRPHLYPVLIKNGFTEEKRLKNHVEIDSKKIDVLIHSKINNGFNLRPATIDDEEITYSWATDSIIRKYAFQQNEIKKQEHKNWFLNQLKNEKSVYFILMNKNKQIGSIRFNIEENKTALISYLIDSKHHGKGYGKRILQEAIFCFKRIKKEVESIHGYVMPENVASCKIFEKLNFEKQEQKDSIKYFYQF